MYKCRNRITHPFDFRHKDFTQKIVFIGWGLVALFNDCLSVFQHNSRYSVDRSSLWKRKKTYAATTQRTHSRFRLETASDLTLFCKVYESKRAFKFLPRTLEKKKARKLEAPHTKYSPTSSRLNIFLRFYGLSIRHHAENVGTLYGFARSNRIDRGKLILWR